MSSLNVYTNNCQSGPTNIGGGLRDAGNALVHSNARPWAVKVIVLMTDGIENRGPDSVSEAHRLAAEGIMIFTVTFAQEANQARMRQVAGAGGGNHYHANDAASLSQVFRDIARRMPTLVTR
jgi:secreted protein with Ig-like and vWFA domain